MKEFIRAFHEELDSQSGLAASTYDTSRRELAETGWKIGSIMGTIEAGIYTPTTCDRLVELDRRKADLEAVRPVDALNEPNTRAEASQALRAMVEIIRLAPPPRTRGFQPDFTASSQASSR
jgi:hypothetical protein